MTIISISLNDTLLKELDKIQKNMGYSGRSEVIRAGARLLISENNENDKLTGEINSIMILIHDHKAENIVSEIKHKFEEVSKTQIHSHLKKDKCLEIFVLEGKAEQIKEMMRLLKTSGKMEYIKLIIP